MSDLEAAADGVVALESRAEHAEQCLEVAQQRLACSTPRPSHDDVLLRALLPTEVCQALQEAARACREIPATVVAHLLRGEHPLGVPLPSTEALGVGQGGDRAALTAAIAVRDWQGVGSACGDEQLAAQWAAQACEVGSI